MKSLKNIIAFLFAAFAVYCFTGCLSLSDIQSGDADITPTLGEKIYKEAAIDGETVLLRLVCIAFSKYDSKGNEIHGKNKYGYEWWYKYAGNGKLVHVKVQAGKIPGKTVYKYDNKGNQIYEKSEFNNSITEWWNEYDINGNIINKRSLSGYEEWYNYDNMGNMIYEKNNEGREIFYSYDTDSCGKVIYKKSSNGIEEWYKYAGNGKIVYEKILKDGKTTEYFYEYFYREDGSIKQKIKYEMF